MNYKTALSILVLAIVIFTAGFFIGNKRVKTGLTDADVKSSYEQGWNDAKKRIEERGLLSQANGQNIYKDIINGKIISINNNIITIEARSLEILSDPVLDKRDVEIKSTTKITKTVKKDDAQYQKEIEQFLIDNPNYKNSAYLPEGRPRQYYETDASLADFSPGQIITVKADEGIIDKKKFTAKEVYIPQTE